jgi:hypothetical protein
MNSMIPQCASRLCGRRLRRIIQPLLVQAVSDPLHAADRYRKRFSATSHAWILILHIMRGGTSLRQSHAEFGADAHLRRRLGLSNWISLSQLARSSTSRPCACFQSLLTQLIEKTRTDPLISRVARLKAKQQQDLDWGVLQQVKAIDSTFLGLSAKLSPWSCVGKHPPGVRVQVELDLALKIPDTLYMSGTDLVDQNALRRLCEDPQELERLRGWTLIMDLGYYAHRHFKSLLGAGVHFLGKVHPQASYVVSATQHVEQKKGWRDTRDDQVLEDHTITLGSPNNRNGAVLQKMRLVISRNPQGKECRLVTSRHDLEAWEVVELYRKRWQIELFFRWVKRQLGAIQPLGYSRQAVWLTVLVGAIVALLWLLIESWQLQPPAMSRISWLRAVGTALQAQATFYSSA